MKKSRPISQVFIFGSIAVVTAAVVVTIIYTNTTLRAVEKNLPITLINELASLDLILDHLAVVAAAAEIAVIKPDPDQFDRLETAVEETFTSIASLRKTYVFDNLVQASAFHAVVAPAIADLQTWLAEGVSGYPARSGVTAELIFTRISGAFEKARKLSRRSRLAAQEKLENERRRLDRFLLGVNLLLLLTLLTAGLMVFFFIRQYRSGLTLRAQRNLLNSLFENILLGISVWQKDGRLLFINRSFTRLTGYEPADISRIDNWFSRAYPDPDYRQFVMDDWAVASKTENAVREFRVVCKGGEEKDIEFRGSFMSDGRALVTLADITERKQGEERLQYFKTAVELSSDAIGMSDPAGRHWYQNKAFDDLFGDIGKDPPASLYADEATGREVFQTIMGGGQWSGEVDMYGRNGHILNILLRAYAIKNTDQQIIGLVGTHTDITEAKQAQAALKESEERFKIAGKASYDLIYEWDVQSDSLEWFGDIDTLLGFDPGEISANIQAWLDLIHPDDRQMLVNAVAFHRTSTRPIRYQYRIRQKDGKWRYWTDNALPLLDDNKLPFKWVGVCTDVTPQKEHERKLEESEQRMRAILEASPDPMVLYDPVGHPRYINPAFTEIFGWTLDELRGSRIPFVPERQKKLTQDKIREIYEHGRPLRFETQRYTKDGRVLDIFLSAAVTKGRDETPTGMVAHLTDITHRKALEVQYEHAQKMESLGTLAGGIAHDFNNLLGGIYGYLDLARKKTTQENVAQYLTKAFDSSERARALTHQLLTFSKGGEPVTRVEPLVPFLEETTRFALSGSNISCRFELPRNLWMCDYDKNQIAQVIDNVVINAHHAMPSGGSVLLRAENVTLRDQDYPGVAKGKYVCISITDTGTGIPEKFLARIFDPFFTTKQKGSGLGLATSYSIVRRHGGIIDVASEPGEGSTFHIYLPAAEPREVAETRAEETDYTGSGKVLIMDDEAVIQEMLSEMLQGMGFETVATSEGDGALAAFRDAHASGDPFVAVVLDLTVPGGQGGKDIVRQIRDMDGQVPVFVASGYSEDAAIADPGRFGFSDSLEKPFSIRQLSRMLEAYLG